MKVYEMVTLQDIAEKTGFSRAVVSRALNPHPDQKVASKTAEIIRQAAETMGYRRNQAASLLAKGASPAIGIFLPFSNDELICALHNGIFQVANQYGFAYNIYNDKKEFEYEDFFNALKVSRNAGVITYLPFNLGGDALPETLSKLLPLNCQVVVANAREIIHSGNVESVMLDNRYGGMLAAEHLMQRKCVRFIYEYAEKSWQREERCAGFVETLNAGGFKPQPFNRLFKETLPDSINEILNMILAGPFPVGVFCNTDLSALKIYAELCRMGKVSMLGQEIKLCGFDDISTAKAVGLTTIAQPFEELGKAAMSMLANRLTGADIPVEKIIKPQLKIRLTT